LKAIVLTPRAVNQIPIAGQALKKKCKERLSIVERSALEDQATEVAVICYDIVGFFFLTELVAIVLRFYFCGFTHRRRSHQRTITTLLATKNATNPQAH